MSATVPEIDYSAWSKEELIARIKTLESAPSPSQQNANSTPAKRVAQITPKNPRKNRPQKTFNFSSHPARPIALRISYLGWSYHGLAAQETDTVPTVESHLFHALTTARLVPDRKSCIFSRCGRTDKGVSSFDQIVGLWVRSSYPVGTPGTVPWEDVEDAKKGGDIEMFGEVEAELDYVGTLNRILPEDIRVLAWSPVKASFDARFDCTYRRYKYFFPAEGLDIRAMRTAAKQYIGVHDFRNFCKVDPAKSITSYERRVLDADVRPLGYEDDPNWADGSSGDGLDVETGKAPSPTNYYVFIIKGHAFLWHQVRCMMAILFLVGSYKESDTLPSTLMDLSAHPAGAGRPAYDIASEIPLVLVECGYADGTFTWRCSDQEAVKIGKGLQDIWRVHATKAVQVESVIKHVLGNNAERLLVDEDVKSKGKRAYIPVMERPRCDSVEERIRKSAEAKQRKRGAGNEDIAIETADADGGKKAKVIT